MRPGTDLWSLEHCTLLEQGMDSSAWLPSFPIADAEDHFEVLALSRVAGPVSSSRLDAETQTDVQLTSVASQTGCSLPCLSSLQDSCTQTIDMGSPISPRISEAAADLDSLDGFLQREQILAQAKAHKRLLLVRLLRECQTSGLLAVQPGSREVKATQTEKLAWPQSPFSSPQNQEESNSWTPFMGAGPEPVAAQVLHRGRSLPSACSSSSEHDLVLREQLQPAASAPHPIDDIIGAVSPVHGTSLSANFGSPQTHAVQTALHKPVEADGEGGDEDEPDSDYVKVSPSNYL